MKALWIIFTIGMLAGCGKEPSKPTLTTDELLKVLGAELFEVTTPKTLDSKVVGGLALRYSDGRITPILLASPWKPDTTYKVIFLPGDGGAFKFVVFNDTNSCRGAPPKLPQMLSQTANPKGRRLGVDEWLMRYSPDSSLAAGDKVIENDIDVISHFIDDKISSTMSSAQDGEQGADGKTPDAPQPPH